MNIYENRLEQEIASIELLDLPHDEFIEELDLSLDLIFGDEE